jgi:hypothetical protein
MSNISIIINADDLGYDNIVNNEISRFAEKRLISSTSLMANGDDFGGAKRVIKNHPTLSVGAHLNLTEFKSLSQPEVFLRKGIVDENFIFNGRLKYRTENDFTFDSELLEAIYIELRLQMEKILDNSINITNIDSHNMIHYWMKLFPVIKKIQNDFNISIVRMKDVKPISFYGLFNSSLKKKTPPLVKELCNLYWNTKMKITLPKTTLVNHVFSYRSLCNYLSTGSKCPRNGIFEVLVHPGCTYMTYFAEENAMVEQEKLKSLIPDYNFINFNHIVSK